MLFCTVLLHKRHLLVIGMYLWVLCLEAPSQFNVLLFLSPLPFCVDETVTLSEVLERLSSYLAQIKVLHKVFCTGVADVPPETPNVVRASHLLNTLYKAIIEYDSIGEASEQGVRKTHPTQTSLREEAFERLLIISSLEFAHKESFIFNFFFC